MDTLQTSNSLQKDTSPKIIPPPTQEDKETARALLTSILETITKVRFSEDGLEKDYVLLGQKIYKLQKDAMWVAAGFDTWKDCFNFLQSKFGKGRTQLFGYVGTVRELGPYIDNKTLGDLGISKASELKKAVVATGKAPSEELVAKGLDSTLAEFRQAVLEEYHIQDHTEKGTWVDLKGCYMTPEEKKVWDTAIDLAKNQDPVVSVTLPAHAQMKEALMRMAEEFIGTYGYKASAVEDSAPWPD